MKVIMLGEPQFPKGICANVNITIYMIYSTRHAELGPPICGPFYPSQFQFFVMTRYSKPQRIANTSPIGPPTFTKPRKRVEKNNTTNALTLRVTFCKKNSIHQSMSTAYHPRTDNQTKNANKHIVQQVRNATSFEIAYGYSLKPFGEVLMYAALGLKTTSRNPELYSQSRPTYK